MDRPELPVSRYRIPEGVVRLLTDRRKQPPYEIRERRQDRRPPSAATLTPRSTATPRRTTSWAPRSRWAAWPCASPAARRSWRRSTPRAREFAPLYLWSRTRTPKSDDAERAQHARPGGGEPQPGARPPGHARAPASATPICRLPGRSPEVMGDVLVSRCGDAYVALVTAGRLGGGAGDREVPRLLQRRQRAGAGNSPAPGWRCRAAQPASVGAGGGPPRRGRRFRGLEEEGRRGAPRGGRGRRDPLHGQRRRARRLPARPPGQRSPARPLEAAAYPRMAAPFLSSPSPGRWSFTFEKFLFRFEPVESSAAAARSDDDSPGGFAAMSVVKSGFGLIKESFKGWMDDGALDLGAALAYYTIFSLAPLLLIVIAVGRPGLGPRGGAGAARRPVAGARRASRARRRSRRWSPTPASTARACWPRSSAS